KALKQAWSGVSTATIAVVVVSALLGLLGWFIWALARATGGWAVLAVLVLLAPLVAALFLPALGQARPAARQMNAQSELRALGMGLEMASARPAADPISAVTPVRVRDWFPETLLWRPQIITDDRGVATIDFALADSITNWAISGAAVTAAGKLGTIDQ